MIWAIAILAATNLGTLAFMAWYVHLESKHKNKMINSLIAKNSTEYLNHEMADKLEGVKQQEPIPELPPDFVEESALSDEEFDKNIINR